jgi:hypothetical protein
MKILAHYLAGLIGGGVLGGIGLALGVVIGGNSGFPAFGGVAAGYEAGGVFFALIGIPFGGMLGGALLQKAQKETVKMSAMPAIIAAILMSVLGIVLYSYDMPSVVFWAMFLASPGVFTMLAKKK